MSPERPAVVLADSAGRICFFSPGAERRFGHAASDALGQSLDRIVPAELRAPHGAAFADGQVRMFPGRFTFLTTLPAGPAGSLQRRRRGGARPIVSSLVK